MFPSNKHILYISPKKITVALVSNSGTAKKVAIKKEIAWVKETLAKKLLDIKKDFDGKFDVLVDDDLTFVCAIDIPADAENERELVRIKMGEEIPQEVGEYGWDFKEILKSADQKEKLVQCALVENDFYKTFSDAVEKADIIIEAMEPIVCSLARLFAERADPELVLYKEEKTLILLTYKGLVFSTMSIDGEPEAGSIAPFLDFIKEKFAITPKKIFLSGKFKQLTNKSSAFAGYDVEVGELNPFVAIAEKMDFEGRDELTLNILPHGEVTSAEAKLEGKIVGTAGMSPEAGVGTQYVVIGAEGKDEQYPQGKLFTGLILVSALLIIVANGIMLYERIRIEQIISAPSPLIITPVPLPEATSTESATSTEVAAQDEVLDKAVYAIEILNGSGERGVTQKLKSILEADGFRVVKTGNADNFDYQGTTVQYKSGVSELFKKAVEEKLAIAYTVQQGPEIGLDGKVDVIIKIGKE